MRDRPRRQGLTLPELVLAICVMSIVALAVATVASALSNAYHLTDTMSESIQSGRSAMMSVASMVRKAKLVLANGGNALAIWTGDANGDNHINVDELVLIQHLEDEGIVESVQVRFPSAMSQDIVTALNEQRELIEVDTCEEVQDAMGSAILADYRSTRVLATDVGSFQVATDTPAPHSRLVLIRITVGPPDQRITLTNSIRLRADAVNDVVMYDGIPVLDLN